MENSIYQKALQQAEKFNSAAELFNELIKTVQENVTKDNIVESDEVSSVLIDASCSCRHAESAWLKVKNLALQENPKQGYDIGVNEAFIASVCAGKCTMAALSKYRLFEEKYSISEDVQEKVASVRKEEPVSHTPVVKTESDLAKQRYNQWMNRVFDEKRSPKSTVENIKRLEKISYIANEKDKKNSKPKKYSYGERRQGKDTSILSTRMAMSSREKSKEKTNSSNLVEQNSEIIKSDEQTPKYQTLVLNASAATIKAQTLRFANGRQSEFLKLTPKINYLSRFENLVQTVDLLDSDFTKSNGRSHFGPLTHWKVQTMFGWMESLPVEAESDFESKTSEAGILNQNT